MTLQTFTFVGISVENGNAKVRFSNDMIRHIKKFVKKNAGTRLDFAALPVPMNKIDALHYMMTCKEFKSVEDQATINDCLEDKLADQRKSEVRIKNLTTAMSLGAIKTRTRKYTTVEDILDTIAS